MLTSDCRHVLFRLLTGVLILALVTPASGVLAAATAQDAPPADENAVFGQGLVCADQATVKSSRNAKVTRTPGSGAGMLISAGGSFSERPVDEPCDIPPAIAPVEIASGGIISATVDGSPAVPCKWSLGNSGSAIVVDYIPVYGDNRGPAQRIAEVALRCEQEAEGGNDTHREIGGVAPGPGLIQAYIGAPWGSGPLTGSCFEQGYQASVQMMEAFPEMPAQAGMALQAGDRLRTENGGYALLEFGPNASMLIQSDAEILGETPPPPPQASHPHGLPGEVVDGCVNAFQACRDWALYSDQYFQMKDWFKEYEGSGLLEPAIRDLGWYNVDTLDKALTAINEGKNEGNNNNACYAGIEAMLILNANASRWSLGRMASTGWRFFGPSKTKVMKAIATVYAPGALPLIKVVSTVSKAEKIEKTANEFVQGKKVADLWPRALVEWRKSKDLSTSAQLDAQLATLRTEIADREAQRESAPNRAVAAKKALLDEPYFANLKKLWEQAVANAAKRTQETGIEQPVIFIWPGGMGGVQVEYARREQEIERKTMEEIFNLTLEISQIEMAMKVLETYRAPLTEMSCDEFLNKLAYEPPTLSPCKKAPHGVGLIEGLLHYLGARGYRTGDETPVQVDGRWIYPKGTEYIAENTEAGGRISVISGSVIVVGEDGAEIEIQAGEQLTWPGDVLSAYDVSQDQVAMEDGLLLSEHLLGDALPVPYGTYTADFTGGQIPDGWMWQDPGNDAIVETPEDRTLRLTVPSENDLWGGRIDAPRLLHKVTGDFDLEGELLLESVSMDLVTAEFLLNAPGSALGYLDNQQPADGDAAHYRIVGGGWVKSAGQNKLKSLACTRPDWNINLCPAAPEQPVRFKLSRRGDIWRGYYSLDGTHWELATQEEIVAPETLWAGWLVKRMAYDGLVDEPAVMTLRDVSLTTAPLGTLEPPVWDFVTLFGEGKVVGEVPAHTDGESATEQATAALHNLQGKKDDGIPDAAVQVALGLLEGTPADPAVALHLDGTQTGTIYAYNGEPLQGDFDVVVRMDAEPWERLPGETRSVAVFAQTVDGSTWVYSAFSETENRRVFNTHAQYDGIGQRYYETPSEGSASTWYRIVRSGDLLGAMYWDRCGWQTLHVYEGAPAEPMFVHVSLGNEWDASQPTAVDATFTIEHMASGPAVYEIDAWQPESCTVLQPVETPSSLVLPQGLTTQSYQAPFDLGNIFFDAEGRAYFFSNERGEQTLLVMEPDGTALPFMESELLAGLNGKAGLMIEDGILMVVDYWPDGGNGHGGLFLLQPDGSFAQWEPPVPGGGLSEIVPAADGGWLLSDFEYGNVWQLLAGGEPAIPLAEQGDRPYGVGALGYDPHTGDLLALYSADWSGTSTTGVFHIADGQAVRMIDAPPGVDNLRDLAVSAGGVLQDGVYMTDPANGNILKLTGDGALTPIISGLTNPAMLAFDPLTGRLLIVYDQDKVLVVR